MQKQNKTKKTNSTTTTNMIKKNPTNQPTMVWLTYKKAGPKL